MLSDAERRELTDIEARLRGDDPVFVERFSGGWQRRSHRLAALVAGAVAAAAVVVGLVLASVVTVVIALTALGVASGMWVTGRR